MKKSVENHIHSLLYEHDCVIIPGFGGLLARRIEACYIEKLQQYVPVRKGVAFNEALKMDDGLLIYTISLREKIHRAEAAQRVSSFVEGLRNRLANDKRVELKGIGQFCLNEEDKCVFDPDTSLNFEAQWFGLPEVTVRPLKDSQLKQQVFVPQEEFTSQSEILLDVDDTSTLRTYWGKWMAAALIAGIAIFVGISMPKQWFETHWQLSSLALNKVSDISSTFVSESNYLKQQSSIVPDAFRVEKSESVITPEVLEPVKPASTITNATPQQFAHELVVGSFTTLSAAEKLQQELVAQGFSGAYVLDKKSGRFFKVIAQGSNDLDEAHLLRTALAKQVGSGVWILSHKK